ncbi:MAG: hypothetical protein WC713_06745 [Candidatus Methylomirabilota bacterium]|jgi:uncharacterized OB-fold protein
MNRLNPKPGEYDFKGEYRPKNMQIKSIYAKHTQCPQCGELLVFPRNDTPYCEDCGWPDEDYGGSK